MAPPGPVADLLADVRELLGAEWAALWRVTPASGSVGAAITLVESASADGRAPSLDAKTTGIVKWAAQQEGAEVATDGDRPRFAATLLPAEEGGGRGSVPRLVLAVASTRSPIAAPRDHVRRWLPRFSSRVAALAALVGARDAAARAERNADLLLFTATQLHDNRSVEELGSSLCSAAVHMTQARRAALVRWNAQEAHGEVVFATRGHLVSPEWPVAAESQVGAACRGDFPVLLEDGSRHQPGLVVYGAPEPPRAVGSLAIIPLRATEGVIGALVIESDTPGQISTADGKNLRLLALLGAAALETVWEIEEINRRARTDSLTGLANRRQFEERLERIVAETNRFGGSCALVVVDIDRFKHVNDTFGHQAGDEVLRRVARILLQAVRVVDLCARYGGEEMALLLPQTDLAGATTLAERLRESVADCPFSVGGREISITISLGVASYPEGARSGDELFAAADRALYEAKRKGRNRVVGDRA